MFLNSVVSHIRNVGTEIRAPNVPWVQSLRKQLQDMVLVLTEYMLQSKYFKVMPPASLHAICSCTRYCILTFVVKFLDAGIQDVKSHSRFYIKDKMIIVHWLNMVYKTNGHTTFRSSTSSSCTIKWLMMSSEKWVAYLTM